MSYKYAIELGGSINYKSIETSIKTIQKQLNSNVGLKLNVQLNTADMKSQLSNIEKQANQVMSKVSKGAVDSKTPTLSKQVIKEGQKTDTFKSQSEFYDKTMVKNGKEVVSVTLDYESALKRANAEQKALQKTQEATAKQEQKDIDAINKALEETIIKRQKETKIITENQSKAANKAIEAQYKKDKAAIDQNTKAYDNLGERIKRLGEQGVISKKAVNSFNDELAKADKLQDQLAKNKAFTQLNQQISDSKKQVMSFGQQLGVAYSKFAIWSVATISWYGIVRALQDMVKQVIELDKAFTGLQMVTKASSKELEAMKDTYIDMAKEFKTSVAEVTNAAEDYLRAGLTMVETNELIEASLVLSKVGAMDSAEATTYLISTMRAYGLEANELMSVVDKLSAVDVAASVSSEGLAIALAKTASSAKLAGVELDRMYGYIAAVKEVSQESDEAIGNFYKTLFARMQQVKIGALTDEDGEDISNVDKVLQSYGIHVMDVNGELRDTSDVLDELAQDWDKYTNAQKSEIATTLAGKLKRMPEHIVIYELRSR